jgi:hypothetical protein
MDKETTEILKAYKEGFKDGYNEAVKFYITNPMINMRPQDNAWSSCSICGKSGFHLSVCNHPKCPSKAYATGAIGAAGSYHTGSFSRGSNGGPGPGY